jgi:hypothetical protein
MFQIFHISESSHRISPLTLDCGFDIKIVGESGLAGSTDVLRGIYFRTKSFVNYSPIPSSTLIAFEKLAALQSASSAQLYSSMHPMLPRSATGVNAGSHDLG